MAVRVFKYGSLVLAVVGVALLLLVARRITVPVVEIGSLSGTMNWAYVRVEGIVTRQPAYDAEAGTLRLWVGDGSDEIMVTAYRPEAELLMAEGLVPRMGDGVALEGTLRIKEEFQYLVLNVPQHTEVRPSEAVAVSIDELEGSPLYQRVTVRGVIRDERTPYEGLRILTLRDAGGEVEVALWTEAATLTGAWPELRVGQPVQVTGAVDRYEGQPQVSVGRASDVVMLEEEIALAPERRIGDLSTALAGELAVVEGMVVEVDAFSAGVKLTLDDDSGAVTLLLWQDLYDSLADRASLVEGARVRTLGEVAEYRGELELVPQLPADVTVLAAAERIVAERQLGELSTDDVGRTVGVEGVLESLRTFSAGVRGTLDDGTGTVTLLLWQEVYEGLADAASLVPGTVLQIEGEVAEYKGELEVVPQAPADVVVVGRVELPQEPLAIGQASTDDVGQSVLMEGRIAEVMPFSRGTRYSLDDGTGTIVLLLWQDVYDGLDDPAALTVGTRVLVRGEVAEYLGELEIVPQLPADLVVTGVEPTAQPTPQATDLVASTPTPQPTFQPTPQPTEPVANPPTSTRAPEQRTIGSISAADVGSTFTIDRAGIAEVDYFSAGVQYVLEDGSGRITLLVWQNVMEEIEDRHDLFPGSQVRVAGEIDEYQGELEIVPRWGTSVQVLDRGERLPIEERSVGEISGSDEGRVFTVEGRVTRSEGDEWLQVWINDGSGELLIYVPTRVVEFLPEGVGVGARLRVTGEVDVYRGQLEIIPLAGADVEVR
jgi:DNA/RNA endonuclease YhcR with UshA esterase domain